MPSIVEPRLSPVPTERFANGCFETMRAYGGELFRLQDHLDRLYGSAQYLGTRVLPRRLLSRKIRDALKRSGLREAVVRIALIPQLSEPAYPHIVVCPAIRPTALAYAQGVRISVVPARKFSVGSIDPQAKYSARLGSVLAVMDAQLRRVDEALFLDTIGSVTESTASNFAIVKKGTIITPACALGLLAGITRDVVRELAERLKIPYLESPLTRHELYNADEAFLLSTLKEVLPVTTIDGRRIGNGHPGPISKKLLREFRKQVQQELGISRRSWAKR
ncbi:MAG: aminotransferase class IV family protein [Candidatus Omnitrophica bacterium]|nr:aminotransferase class IV family protein [Candidatus Omnitrophota bacterium]